MQSFTCQASIMIDDYIIYKNWYSLFFHFFYSFNFFYSHNPVSAKKNQFNNKNFNLGLSEFISHLLQGKYFKNQFSSNFSNCISQRKMKNFIYFSDLKICEICVQNQKMQILFLIHLIALIKI